jgi:hypothetical protein
MAVESGLLEIERTGEKGVDGSSRYRAAFPDGSMHYFWSPPAAFALTPEQEDACVQEFADRAWQHYLSESSSQRLTS